MVDTEKGLARADRRNRASDQDASEARIEEQPLEFHKRVQQGYRKIAALEPARFRMVDASGEPSQVAERVWAEVSPLLAKHA